MAPLNTNPNHASLQSESVSTTSFFVQEIVRVYVHAEEELAMEPNLDSE